MTVSDIPQISTVTFAHRCLYNERFLHTKLLHTNAFAQKPLPRAALTYRNFSPSSFDTQKLLRTGVLHTEVLTLSSFYIKQAAFTTQMILHTKACTKRKKPIYIYSEQLLHRELSTRRNFYKQSLSYSTISAECFLLTNKQNLHLHPTRLISAEGCLVTNKIRMSVTTNLDTDPDARNLRKGLPGTN